MIWVLAAWTSSAVDFQKDIQPLLKNKCSRCHSGHEAKGGFSINTRTTLLDGAKPGDSAGSLLYQLITSKDPDERMPSKGEPLAAKEIALIKTWIDEGIAWPEGLQLRRTGDARLASTGGAVARRQRQSHRPVAGWLSQGTSGAHRKTGG